MPEKKILTFLRQSTPFDPGWKDVLTVTQGGKKLYKGLASVWCNPVRPEDLAPFYAAYGGIALGEYHAHVCMDHEAFHKCLVIENYGKVPSVWPNAINNWERYMKRVYYHEGNLGSKNPKWRGSAGCLTSPKAEYKKVMSLLKPRENVIIRITGADLVIGLFSESHFNPNPRGSKWKQYCEH